MRSDKHLRIAIDGESASGKSYASKIIGKHAVKVSSYITSKSLFLIHCLTGFPFTS